MQIRRSLAVAALPTSLIATPPALAGTAVTSDGAAKAWNSGNTLYVTDTKGDDHAVYGNANHTGNRLNNHSGYGSTVSKTYNFKVTAVRACVNLQLQSDRCSAWR
ncbi:hypothetical protein [Actinomyces qiguomingii]|uniref:hypothetical protein n=1 Tax=Actinomyces qiguomingii TaxID=2057800 RepID=UPI000CA03DF6|nr:hypothetical protein [Actinomyces qiguomingii]